MRQDAPHFVYRCYDADGALLYIGCTHEVKRRIAAHRRGHRQVASRWLQACMTRYEVEGPFPGREAGRDAERNAIVAEVPLFNYQERRDRAAWMSRGSVARYLVERGHLSLALETTCMCDGSSKAADAYDSHCFAHVAAQVAGLTDLRCFDDLSAAEQDAAFLAYCA